MRFQTAELSQKWNEKTNVEESGRLKIKYKWESISKIF